MGYLLPHHDKQLDRAFERDVHERSQTKLQPCRARQQEIRLAVAAEQREETWNKAINVSRDAVLNAKQHLITSRLEAAKAAAIREEGK